MRDTMLAHGLRPPAFDFKDGYFVVTLPGQDQAWSAVRVSPALTATLEEPQQKIIELLAARGALPTRVCAAESAMSLATARRHLRVLVEKGLVKTRGRGPSRTYNLAEAQ